MGRTKESFDRAAEEAFRRNIAEKLAGRGCYSQEALGAVIGCHKDSAGKYRRDPMEMRLKMLRSLVRYFKPDPFLLLEAVGYSKSEITKRCKEHLA